MKLTTKDRLSAVYYTRNTIDSSIDYKGKTIVLNTIKIGKRDTKGTKIRV